VNTQNLKTSRPQTYQQK